MARGMGTIRRLPSGSYQARLYIGNRRHCRAFEKRSHAVRWLKTMRVHKIDVEAGARYPAALAQDVTYEELVPELLEHYRSGARRVYTPRTLRSYELQLARLEAYWGRRRVTLTRAVDVDRWVASMRREGLATSTIRHQLDRLSQLHRLARRRGYLANLPCSIERPRLVLRSERRALDEDQVDALVAAAAWDDDPQVLAVVLLASDAGLRRAEIHRLMGQDVRLEAGYLHVAVRGEGDRTKSGRGRNVPILTDRLREVLGVLPLERGRRVVVEGRLGGRSPDAVSSLVGIAWTRAGLEGRPRLHELRHRFATRLAEGNRVSAEKLRRWMGHRTLSVTQGYFHVDAAAPAGAGDALEGKPLPRRPAAKVVRLPRRRRR